MQRDGIYRRPDRYDQLWGSWVDSAGKRHRRKLRATTESAALKELAALKDGAYIAPAMRLELLTSTRRRRAFRRPPDKNRMLWCVIEFFLELRPSVCAEELKELMRQIALRGIDSGVSVYRDDLGEWLSGHDAAIYLLALRSLRKPRRCSHCGVRESAWVIESEEYKDRERRILDIYAGVYHDQVADMRRSFCGRCIYIRLGEMRCLNQAKKSLVELRRALRNPERLDRLRSQMLA